MNRIRKKTKSKPPPVRLGQTVYVLEYSPFRIEKSKVIEVGDTSFRIEVFLGPNMIHFADSSWYTFNELSWNRWIFTDENIANQELENVVAYQDVKSNRRGSRWKFLM